MRLRVALLAKDSCGVPVSESVMFERSEQVADRALPVYMALKQERISQLPFERNRGQVGFQGHTFQEEWSELKL
jgi:hypothetical protein